MTDLEQLAKNVVTNAKSRETQQLAQKYGLNVQTRVWEDMSRTKGSVWGPAISDMTLQVKGVDMPIIRYPNFSDRTWDISLDDIKVVVGNQRRGEKVRFITLREYLHNFGNYLTDREPGLSLLAPRDSEAIVSAQATMLPVEKNQNTPFNVAIFNYQTDERDPAVLAIVVSANGSSAQVVNEDDMRGQKLYFNDAGQRTSFVATRLSDYRAEQGKSTSGPMTEKEKALNGLLVIQVPLKQHKRHTPFPSYIYESSNEMMSKSFATMSAKSSDVENVVIRPGQPEGEYDEIHAPEPQGQKTDEKGKKETERAACGDSDRERQCLPQYCHGIDADAEKCSRGQRDVPGGAREDRPAQGENHVHEDRVQRYDPVGFDIERCEGQREHGEDRERRSKRSFRDECARIHIFYFPRMPFGLRRRIAMKIT